MNITDLRQSASPTDTSWSNMMSGIRPVGGPAAQQLSAVSAAVSAITMAVTPLPVRAYTDSSRSETADIPHLRRPNRHQTWVDYIEYTLAQVLIFGNSLTIVTGDELQAVPWTNVFTEILPSGRMRYSVSEHPRPNSQLKIYLDDEVMHIRDRSDDGYMGISRLSRCSSVVSNAVSLEDAAQAVWHNGVFPSGVLSVEGRLSDEQRDAMRHQLNTEFRGESNRAKVLIADGKTNWQTTSPTPEDAELLSSRTHAIQEVARIYNVPPPLLQEYSNNTFTNSESAGRWFAQFTLSHWISKLEQSLTDAIGYDIDIDLTGLLRGDHETRWAAWKIAIEAGVYTPEEIRRMEGEA